MTELELLLEDFNGAANRTRCFSHIANLIAKAILRPFDVGKGAKAFEDGDDRLSELAEGLEVEEAVAAAEYAAANEAEGGENEEDWLAELADLSAVEQDELRENSRPVQFVLVKVIR